LSTFYACVSDRMKIWTVKALYGLNPNERRAERTYL
jgi:hypothetical protein